jgi:hypothetical protein
MKKGLYAIIDKLANDIGGNFILITSHEGVAIRHWEDVARVQNGPLQLHPADHELVRLGWLNEDLTITGDRETIITGARWAAANQQPE